MPGRIDRTGIGSAQPGQGLGEPRFANPCRFLPILTVVPPIHAGVCQSLRRPCRSLQGFAGPDRVLSILTDACAPRMCANPYRSPRIFTRPLPNLAPVCQSPPGSCLPPPGLCRSMQGVCQYSPGFILPAGSSQSSPGSANPHRVCQSCPGFPDPYPGSQILAAVVPVLAGVVPILTGVSPIAALVLPIAGGVLPVLSGFGNPHRKSATAYRARPTFLGSWPIPTGVLPIPADIGQSLSGFNQS